MDARSELVTNITKALAYNHFVYGSTVMGLSFYEQLLNEHVQSQPDGTTGSFRLGYIDGSYYITKPILASNKDVRGVSQVNCYLTFELADTSLDKYFSRYSNYIFFSPSMQPIRSDIDN